VVAFIGLSKYTELNFIASVKHYAVLVRCFSAVSLLLPLFPAVIFLPAMPKYEGFRGRGRSSPLFFHGKTAKNSDSSGRWRVAPVNVAACVNPD
jgi:hypothetical protein